MYAQTVFVLALATLAFALPNPQDFVVKGTAQPGYEQRVEEAPQHTHSQAHHNGTVVTTTKVVSAYTTYCPEPTTFDFNGKKYVVEKPTTLTITECPCTIVEPCFTCPPPASTTNAKPPPAVTPPPPAPAPPAPFANTPAPPAQVKPTPGVVTVNGAAEKGVSFVALAGGLLAMMAI